MCCMLAYLFITVIDWGDKQKNLIFKILETNNGIQTHVLVLRHVHEHKYIKYTSIYIGVYIMGYFFDYSINNNNNNKSSKEKY